MRFLLLFGLLGWEASDMQLLVGAISPEDSNGLPAYRQIFRGVARVGCGETAMPLIPKVLVEQGLDSKEHCEQRCASQEEGGQAKCRTFASSSGAPGIRSAPRIHFRRTLASGVQDRARASSARGRLRFGEKERIDVFVQSCWSCVC
jgi:hypothetical protein